MLSHLNLLPALWRKTGMTEAAKACGDHDFFKLWKVVKAKLKWKCGSSMNNFPFLLCQIKMWIYIYIYIYRYIYIFLSLQNCAVQSPQINKKSKLFSQLFIYFSGQIMNFLILMMSLCITLPLLMQYVTMIWQPQHILLQKCSLNWVNRKK